MSPGGPWRALKLLPVLWVMLQTLGCPWWYLLLIWGVKEENWVGLGVGKGVLSSGKGASAPTPYKGGGVRVVVLGVVTGLSA